MGGHASASSTRRRPRPRSTTTPAMRTPNSNRLEPELRVGELETELPDAATPGGMSIGGAGCRHRAMTRPPSEARRSDAGGIPAVRSRREGRSVPRSWWDRRQRVPGWRGARRCGDRRRGDLRDQWGDRRAHRRRENLDDVRGDRLQRLRQHLGHRRHGLLHQSRQVDGQRRKPKRVRFGRFGGCRLPGGGRMGRGRIGSGARVVRLRGCVTPRRGATGRTRAAEKEEAAEESDSAAAQRCGCGARTFHHYLASEDRRIACSYPGSHSGQ